MHIKLLLCFLTFLLYFSCNQDKKLSNHIHFFDDQNFNSDFTFDKFPLGGISGIKYKDDKVFAISDDRSEHAPARIVVFSLEVNSKSFELTPIQTIILKDKKGKVFKEGTVDFESIDIFEDNSFLITSEGAFNKKIEAKIYHFSQNGLLLNTYSLHSKYNHHKNNSGLRDNLSLESLTIKQGTSDFFVAAEESLIQDGPPSSGNKASFIRMILFKNGIASTEFAYPNSPMPNPTNEKKLKGINGLVEIEHFKDHIFLSLERAWSPTTNRQSVKLFFFNTIKASNVENFTTLRNKKFTPVKKILLYDFDTMIPKLEKKYQRLDNIEAMTFGPKLKDGSQLIIFASDNNFSKYQRTFFSALKVRPRIMDPQ